MNVSGLIRSPAASLLAIVCLLFTSRPALAQSDGYVLYLNEYLTGDYYYASLWGLDSESPPLVNPRQLRLPRGFRRNVELGNADVSIDGTTIVFAARSIADLDWDIYTGTIDRFRRRIRNVQGLIQTSGGRDEDPRISWDGASVVYKCDGNICIYPEVYPNPVVESWCELWAPSFAPSGYAVSYTKRCGDGGSDRIWEYDLLTGEEAPVPNIGGGADRFAYYLDDGRLVYSHIDSESGTSSLWEHDTGSVSLLHDRTSSDDDPYPDKHDRDRIAFIGWNDDSGHYDLYLYRRSHGDSVRLTGNRPVLGPVLFR
ncbi:MAG: hypothetical protein KJO31_11425 [Gammaproteobacteria bacterium]|nr:hypothetical protein [Gammaproteobacteria bacterium]